MARFFAPNFVSESVIGWSLIPLAADTPTTWRSLSGNALVNARRAASTFTRLVLPTAMVMEGEEEEEDEEEEEAEEEDEVEGAAAEGDAEAIGNPKLYDCDCKLG